MLYHRKQETPKNRYQKPNGGILVRIVYIYKQSVSITTEVVSLILTLVMVHLKFISDMQQFNGFLLDTVISSSL